MASGNGVVNTNLAARRTATSKVQIVLRQSQRRCGIELQQACWPSHKAIADVPFKHGWRAILNLALAKILNGDANGARTTLQNGDSTAIADYLLAVAARLDDVLVCASHSRRHRQRRPRTVR